MENIEPPSGHEHEPGATFSIHEDKHDVQQSVEKGVGVEPVIASLPRSGILPLETSIRANHQRDLGVSLNEKGKMEKHHTKSSKLDEQSHRILLRTLEEHCKMTTGENLAKNGQIECRGDENGLGRSISQPRNLIAANHISAKVKHTAEGLRTSGKSGEKTVTAEMELLKQELEAAKHKIATQEEQLTVARTTKLSSGQASPNGQFSRLHQSDKHGGAMGFAELGRGLGAAHPGSGVGYEDAAPFDPEPGLGHVIGTPQNFNGGFPLSQNANAPPFLPGSAVWTESSNGNCWRDRFTGEPLTALTFPQKQWSYGAHNIPGLVHPTSSSHKKAFDEYDPFTYGVDPHVQSSIPAHQSGLSMSKGSRRGIWDVGQDNTAYSYMNNGLPPRPMNVYQQGSSLTPRPIGTPLSATASEFSAGGNSGPWNSASSIAGHTYVPTTEPLNYRRLLDRNVSCNWKYIVDKIVCNNDQQASIFLQQKLKVGTVEQKYEIVEAIVAQAYPLMINRFGNFLVQRCFEHGTPEQVVAIANAIRGNTLNLSMDAFGCHVVQKAFDAVPEEYKAIMVHELLRRIPETVIHRYACHVWQKLFELRWSDSPPQIMKYVNEALQGMWHEVALGETGSLVVQNIFENCLEEDKRPCINEVLNSIDIIAHGQFGNWCIQHICEHGLPADRSKAIDHVLRYATEYSMDQFASKVVEKCLKIGGTDFLERYLDRVCEGRADRPRIPLIDIASDQYGNYLIQYILTHASGHHREIVAAHIRKHMVSLRGSKFGSRVGMLCSNPAYATRSGPGAGTSTNRFSGNGNGGPSRYSPHYR